MTGWNPARLAHPRFARLSDLVERLGDERDWPSIARMNDAFAGELARVGMRLVEAPKVKPALRPDGTIDPESLYEVRIVERGEIPTRPRNAHDLLNALIWAAFPRSKLALTRALAAIQRTRAAGRSTMPPTRTREHDRLALVDEGGLLCVTHAGDTSVWIFGHAILEHTYTGDLAVRGTPIDLDVIEPSRDAIDRAFAAADLATVVRAGPGIAVD